MAKTAEINREDAIRRGSTRVMRPHGPGLICLEYLDTWSAFDRGRSPQSIRGIGQARCACAVRSFQLAKQAGLPTHFVEQIDRHMIVVQEFAVPGQKPLSGTAHGRVLPVEHIWRDRAYGSLMERVASGEVTPEDLGFAPGTAVTEGVKLPALRQECTTKFEAIDRHLSDDEARVLAGLSSTQWHDVRYMVSEAIAATNAAYEEVGFMCPDGKLEIGYIDAHDEHDDGQLVLVDVFGTQDENRIIDIASGEMYSKDLIRGYLNKRCSGWKVQLREAKRKHPSNPNYWPPYPMLPMDLVELVASRYAEVAHRYAGVRVDT